MEVMRLFLHREMDNIRARQSFFKKNFIFSVAMMLIPLLIFNFFVLGFTQEKLKNELEENAARNLQYTKEQLNQIFIEISYFKTLFVSNPQMNLRLLDSLAGNPISYADALATKDMYNYISALSGIKPAIHSIYLSRLESDYMIVGSNRKLRSSYFDTEWYTSFKEQSPLVASWMEVRQIKQYSFEKETMPVLSVFLKLNYNGIMVVNLDLEYFEKLLANNVLYPGQSILLLDSKNNIICSSGQIPEDWKIQDESFTGNHSGTQRKKDYYEIRMPTANNFNLTCVSLIPFSSVYEITNLILKSTVILSFILIVISGIFSFYRTRNDYRQISKIINTFDLAQQNKPLPVLEYKKEDAYSFILQNVVQSFIKQSYLDMQLTQRQLSLFSAQLAALQYQINPHFLFNTLQSISLEIQKKCGIDNSAVLMVGQLSDILRYSLGSPDKAISIKEEIEIAKTYVELQKYRYCQKIMVFWEYSQECLQCKIARMLLQPIIENAFAHSKREEQDILVKIRLRYKNGNLQVKVIDNGIGMPPEKLRELKDSFQTPDDPIAAVIHIGLKNINARLRLLYPENRGLIIRSRLNLGTVAEFNIPQDFTQE